MDAFMSTFKVAPSLRVMLLDDHEVMRYGLEILLRQEFHVDVVGSFKASCELLNQLHTKSADVLLIDYSLGPEDVDGLNLIKFLNVRYPGERVLVISAHYNAPTVALAMNAGAHGFVGKGQGHKELIEAIRAVAAGRTYVHAEMSQNIEPLVQNLPDHAGEPGLFKKARLSPKESEVVRCYLDGMTVTQIAAKFSRSVATISSQKASAYRKLGVRSNSELFKLRDLKQI